MRSGTAGARTMRWRRRPVAHVAGIVVVIATVALLVVPLVGAARGGSPASADGLAPCSVGPPPFPYAGYCGTFDGDNTWYGTYGPNFPTAQGWAFCADPPASGADYPAPRYNYVPGGAPPGAGGDWNALGFAFSQAQAAGYWNGAAGQFTRDQVAAAGKFLYDAVVWGTPVPSMDGGTLAAYDVLATWFNEARGTTGPPQISVGLVGGGTTIDSAASYAIHVAFPGTGRGLAGLGILVGVTNANLDAPNGPTFAGASTDANGNLVVPIFVTSPGPVTITVTSDTEVGQVGIGFYHETVGPLDTQQIAGFPAPINLQASEQLYSNGLPQGTISVQKAGNDQAYWGVGGAVFHVADASGAVVAVLATGADGSAGPTGPLPVGTYTVSEVTPPAGYRAAAPQTVTVAGNQDATVSFTGADQDQVVPATVTIEKTDRSTGAPLAGAVFDVKYDSRNDGVYDEDLGTCTTDALGRCSPAGNDGGSLLPGDYEVTEVAAPPGYYLDPATATQTLALDPGQSGTVAFSDLLLGSLRLTKTGNDVAYTPVVGAVFSVTGPAPATSVAATLTIGSDGQSQTVGGLVPGQYTVTETRPPVGYTAVKPFDVAVPGGPTTTDVAVDDPVVPASVTLVKLDAQTLAPLAGAVLDVRYATGAVPAPDPAPSGTAPSGVDYDEDLGHCTTGPTGTCTPPGNDGGDGLLPGDYEVTEVAPPPGYPTTSPAPQYLTLGPGGFGRVIFTDQPYLSVRFEKVSTGNVDPAQVQLAGAVVVVHAGTLGGPAVTSCTTDAAGACTTASSLVGGRTYCWMETLAPARRGAGANGCFTATESRQAEPIVVTDPGEFVAVAARKVVAGAPSVTLPGAVFDLFRSDGGHGPDRPPPPPGVSEPPGQTWVARATSGPDGLARFPLQFPGYAYCVAEVTPPPDYLAAPGQACTPVLAGATSVPPPLEVVSVADAHATVTLTAHKYNALQPGTGVPGATYDLYVEGPLPPGLPVPSEPPGPGPAPPPVPGDTWLARGTTDPSGDLAFTVPAGYAYCLEEVATPVDYVLDPALHCTAVLDTGGPAGATRIALPETTAVVYLTAHKFDSLRPDTVIPGATYELLVKGTPPPAAALPRAPAGAPVPPGTTYWAEGTSDAHGVLSFAVPAGHAWCLHELVVPRGYRLDTAFHCTAVLHTDTPLAAMSVALPELPLVALAATPSAAGPVLAALAYTGGPEPWLPLSGGLLLAVGGWCWLVGRRREKRAD
ncbi:MAG: SpaA isopeptide-forming pilin-related protein [Acidimicrobiales bacterium]